MNFNFGEVLTRAWQITWKYKVLWIFGILASCSRGGGGGSSGGSSVSGGSDGNGYSPFDTGEAGRVFEQIGELADLQLVGDRPGCPGHSPAGLCFPSSLARSDASA